MSRVMLAVKTTLAEADPVPTLVFDEIDTGVGGRLGASLGRKLAELARHHQVICVTHLPQMASYAAHQWIIRKTTDRGRTRTTITPLGEEERVDELAAMLRGDSAAEGTRQEALSMLMEARGRR
jgi:DNA repair protein RecN (Recombination protein N)